MKNLSPIQWLAFYLIIGLVLHFAVIQDVCKIKLVKDCPDIWAVPEWLESWVCKNVNSLKCDYQKPNLAVGVVFWPRELYKYLEAKEVI